jgi:nucleoid-associated protein YgaU
MAKPYPQTGHGSVGGTEDESALAHREAAGSDAEDGHEADWDVPASPDNSTLSRILGLVLVVVLAGVFSFVAYRKYQEAKHNPDALTVDATAPGTEGAAGEKHADASNSPFDGEHDGNTHENLTGGARVAGQGTAGIAHLGGTSANGFGSLDEQGANRGVNPAERNHQQNRAGAGSVALTPAGHSAPAGGHETEANPFGDLGGQPERRPQQPPAQSEPGQPVAGGAQGGASPFDNASPSGRVEPNGKFAPNGGQDFAGSRGQNAGLPAGSAGAPHATAAKADSDMQNLFPDENGGRRELAGQNPQHMAARENQLEPAGLAKTAQLPNQMGQNNAGRNPPAQSEPLDNDTLDEHPHVGHPTTAGNGVVHFNQNAHATGTEGFNPGAPSGGAAAAGAPMAGASTSGRAEALLGGNERSPSSGDSPFGGEPPQQRTAGTASLNASSNTLVQNGEPRPAAGSDDPFGGNRPGAGTGSAERFSQSGSAERFSPSATAENPLAQPAHATTSPGAVSPVGTISDAGDYYVVQPQDNFWTISRKKYGNARYFQALAELNKSRIPDPSRMRPGMKVSTPPVEVLEERYGQFLPAGTRVQTTAAEDTSAKSAPTGFFISPDGTAKYRTGEHDTLSEIASKHLGRSSRWIQIYEMNRDKLSNPNQVKVGLELALPGDASSVGLSSEVDERR